ncbi:OmpA family protein [Enterovibrio makurazakiensis]|uniref:OmpA family protein n=1 Tax=Enterovibrio makurazakiensis TaxID=2910232 RepID=UPI003D21EA79
MNKLILLLPALFLAGCANQEIITMEDASPQVSDLRDLDNDGVIKARELCDETLSGAAVNNDGCAKDKTVKQSFRLDVKFPNDSAQLLPSYYGKLEQLAAFLEEQDGAVVTIEGHASKVGSASYNLALSQRRADAVANALVEDFDIPASRVEAIGYGHTEPLMDEDSELAHETNRRVMASLSGEYNVTDMRWTIFTSE